MRARVVFTAVVVLVLSGCDWYYNTLPSPDDLVKLVPWFDHMITSPAFHPYERADIPRRSVPGTVPVTPTESDWGTEWRAANYAVADTLVNPTNATATLALGDTLYGIYCGVCHGLRGAADGPVTPKIGAPSLLTEKARVLSDGSIYSTIRYGVRLMPRYGDKIVRPTDRWAIVNYVRKLQADAPGASGAR